MYFACTFPKINEIKIKRKGSDIIHLVYYLQMAAKQQNSSHKNCLCNTPKLYTVTCQTHQGWRNWESRLVKWKGLCCRRYAVLHFYCHLHGVPVRSRWIF